MSDDASDSVRTDTDNDISAADTNTTSMSSSLHSAIGSSHLISWVLKIQLI
jgi:hypothetical protein